MYRYLNSKYWYLYWYLYLYLQQSTCCQEDVSLLYVKAEMHNPISDSFCFN